MGGQQKRPQRRRDKPEPVQSAAELARSDAGALTSTLLRAWAWHPHAAALLHDSAAQSLPLDFDPVESYQQLFQPLIVAEACAGLQRQFQEEVGSRNGLVLDVTLKRAAQVSDQRTDVECTLRARSPHVLSAALRKLKQEWGIVLLCSSRPGGGSLETFCQGGGGAAATAAKAAAPRGLGPSAAARAPASTSDIAAGAVSNGSSPSQGASAAPANSHSTASSVPGSHGPQPSSQRPPPPGHPRSGGNSTNHTTPPPSPPGDGAQPVVVAGVVKYCPKHSGELMLLEVQTGFDPLPCQGAAAKHPCPTALQQLMQAFEVCGGGAARAPGDGGPQWALVFLGSPVTPQREMAALEAMMRQPLLPTLAQPSRFLADLGGGVLRKVWPAEARSQMFFNRLKAQFDESQLEAIECCASLVARPEQAAADLAGQPVLPIVLIQGPPGTGKTHTVKGILNTWHIALFQRSYDSLNAHLETKLEHARAPAQGKAASLPPPNALDTCPLASTHQVERVARPRILVCAPSNAATDELLERVLTDRFADLNGDPYTPSLLRIGSEMAKDSNLSDAAKQVYEENMCREMFSLHPEAVRATLRARQSELHQCSTSFALCWHKLKQDLLEGERQAEMISLVKLAEDERRAKANVDRWTAVNECVSLKTRSQWEAEEAVALSFMEDAEIVFTTLSSTGRRLFSRISRPFDLVLIDEAAQASEVASLQPLVLGSGRLVMVGDPQQLPATVLSKVAKALNLERSLFERLMAAGWPVKMLSVQYRMHRSIRSFPSKHFYDNKLRDGANVVNRPHMPYYDHGLLKPYVIFDVEAGRDVQHGDGGSRYNVEEINMALALFQELSGFLNKLVEQARAQNKPGPPGARVGVITPYRKQVEKMREAFTAVLGEDVARDVKIDTVDSFQGKQMDVIILSCVRGSAVKPDRHTNTQALLGFVQDVRRMNVAITRAQSALWILGNVATLSMDDTWKALIDDGRSRNKKGGVIVEKADAADLFPDARLWAPPGAALRGVKRPAPGAPVDGNERAVRGAVAENGAREGAGTRVNARHPRLGVAGGGNGEVTHEAAGLRADEAGPRDCVPGVARDPRRGPPAQNSAAPPPGPLHSDQTANALKHGAVEGGVGCGQAGVCAASVAPGGVSQPRGGAVGAARVVCPPADPRTRAAARATLSTGPGGTENVSKLPRR